MTHGSKSLWERDYYDSPDGQDLAGKFVYMNKWAGFIGFAAGTFDVLMVSHTKGYLATLARYMTFMGPSFGVASAYTVGSYAAHSIRGKDDFFNQIVGAMGAGGALGAATHRPQLGMLAVVAICKLKISLRLLQNNLKILNFFKISSFQKILNF